MGGVPRWAAVVLGTALVLALCGAPAGAADACHTIKRAGAHKGSSGRNARAPYVVGDSTMLLATPYLGKLGIEADARGCRQFSAGLQMLAARRAHGTLANVAVLALGANGSVGGDGIARALRTIGRTRVLGLVTPRNSGASASAMRRAAHSRPQRVMVIDWAAFSAGHGNWFSGDGLHVNYTGARAYAGLIRRRLDPFIGPSRALRVPASVGAGKVCGSVRRAGRRLSVFVIRGPHIRCERARHLVRLGTLRRIRGWRAYDFERQRRKPWTDIYVRSDRKIIVAARRP